MRYEFGTLTSCASATPYRDRRTKCAVFGKKNKTYFTNRSYAQENLLSESTVVRALAYVVTSIVGCSDQYCAHELRGTRTRDHVSNTSAIGVSDLLN